MNISRPARPTSIRHLAVAAAAALACAGAFAGDNTATGASARQAYSKDRAACEAGKTAEDKATCLKEAGAAEQERARNRLSNDGSMRQNALDRCNELPAKDRADCVARVDGPSNGNQRVTTSGSVAGGGVLKETTTTTPGSVTVIVPPPETQAAPKPSN